METLNLNKIPSGSNPVVHCSQYDVGRVFRFNLFEGSEVVTLDGTETIECNVRKLDGTIVTVAVTNTSDSYVDVVTTEQMTAVHGSNFGEIVFKKGSDVIGTVNFILQVEKSPLEGGITSDSSIYNLETQIMDIVSVQYDSANVIFDNAGTSGHGIPYTVTSEGIKTMVDDAIALIPEELNDLSDVDITTPTSGEAVVWDGAKWVNGTVSTVGDLDDLSDVDTTGKADGDSLRYDANASEWIAQPTTVALTQAEYDALALSGDLVPNTHYVITDAQNLNPTASDIEYSGGVTVKQQLDKAILYNQNGIFITRVGHSYLASFSSAKISDVYTVLDDYNPSGVFLNAVWNSDTAKANVVRINSGTVTVLDTNPWSAIASTDTTKIQGSLAWND